MNWEETGRRTVAPRERAKDFCAGAANGSEEGFELRFEGDVLLQDAIHGALLEQPEQNGGLLGDLSER